MRVTLESTVPFLVTEPMPKRGVMHDILVRR